MSGFGCLPGALIDDAKIRDFGDGQILLPVWTRHSLSRLGILDISQTVPDQPADIEFIIENAGASFPVSMDC
ncbi:hypothetical protein TM49_04675 [Martelella endophytica]|uniref:Uncharacterized protein n=1 Tax=Martelella endophytica TaxID=1486262 RepID=A0A0D5LLS0_MAREN|nr:hypothetical protein TM49_04675 [Martelella endophytica]